MSILTKAAAPVKGTATLFTLDKAALAAVTSVAADAYFSDSAKWKSIDLVYHSSVGNQNQIVKFNASQSSPTSDFLVSTRARNIFQIQKIVIKDFDGGTFEVLRSELTTAEFDIDFSVVAPVGPSAFFTRDFSSPNSLQPNERLLFGAVYGTGQINFSGNGNGGWYVDDTVNSLVTVGVSYKVRLFFTGFLGETGYESVQFAFAGTSQFISRTQLAASLGSYLDITVVADSNANSLLVSLEQHYYENSLSLTKIQIFEL